MPQRVNGSVFTDQVLSGSLRHFVLIGADFKNGFDSEAPKYGSAAEEVARVITQKATIAIYNPLEIGISFALETNRSTWDVDELEAAIRALGDNVGTDGLDLTNVRLNEVEYNFLDSSFVYVVPDPTIDHLRVNNTYFVASPATLTLPDYTSNAVDVGSLLRIIKYENIEVTLETQNGQSVKDLLSNQTGTSYTYTVDEELIVVFDGAKWAVVRGAEINISDVLGLQAALDAKQDLSEKGQPLGYAGLDGSGLVPASQLPSYVDDVLEYPTVNDFPVIGETGKIYVAINTGRVYRWTGTVYAEISSRPPDTDEVPEGSTNLYYTDQRVRDAVSGGTGITYDSGTGEFSIGQPVAITDDVSFASVTADFIGNLTGQVSDISNFTTDDLVEGVSNLYYTDQRVDDRIANLGFKNVLYVDDIPTGQNEFASIADAITEIANRGDIAVDNPYVIEVGAGDFTEGPFTIPQFVTLKGQGESTVLRPSDLTQDFITMTANSYIDSFTLLGPTSANTYTIRVNDSIPGAATAISLVFRDAWGFMAVQNNSALPLATVITNTIVDSQSGATQPFLIESTSTGSLVVVFNGIAHLLINPAVTIDHYFEIIGTETQCVINEGRIEGTVGTINHVVHTENGPEVLLTTVSLVDCNVSIHADNVGAGPFIRSSALISDANTWDLLIENPGTTGSITGTMINDKINIVDGSPLIVSVLSTTGDEVGYVQIGDFYQGDKESRLINLSKLVRSSASLGLVEGGQITEGPGIQEIVVAAGTGYVESTIDDYVFEVLWEETSFFLNDGDEVWITVDADADINLATASPGNLYNVILLGRVYAQNGIIEFIEDIANDNNQKGNRQDYYLRDAIGPIYAAGSIVSASTTSFQLNVSSGRYYYSSNSYAPSGGNDILFTLLYRDGAGGFTEVIDTQLVPVKYDDNSGTLADPTAGYYVKHALYLVGEGANEYYYLVVGQEENDNLSVAEQADLPLPPGFVSESFVLIASVIVQQGNSDIVSIFDERPVIGFKASGVSASTTHGNLLGLNSDDHTQYLLVDGTRAMGGNLDMGNNAISNITTANGVTIESHSSRHLPNGADPLPVGIPSTIGTANSEGIQNVFARQDHVHAHGNQPGGSLHSLATTTTPGFMSASDKLLLDNISTDDVAEGSNLYFTTQRARDSINDGTGVTYDSGTGTISIGQDVATTATVTFSLVNANLVGNVTGQVSDISNFDTGDLSEGANLYFTTQRARDSINDGTGVTYDSVTGTISIGQDVGTTATVTFTQVNANLVGNVTGQVSDISNHDTDDLSEGLTNLYFTDERVDDRVSNLLVAGTDISLTYDDVANTLTIDADSTPLNVPETIVARSADETFEITAIDINTDNGASRLPGRLRWSTEDGGLEVGMEGGEVNLQIGQEVLQKIFNNTGTQLVSGQIVIISGSLLGNLLVDLALADENFNPDTVLGMVTETIEDQSAGFVTAFGKVRDLDTSAYTVGTDLYLSSTVPGGFTSTVPPAPNKSIYIGIVARQSATIGEIFVRPGNSESIDELSDVTITNILNNQILQWDGEKFINTSGLSTFAAATHASNHLPSGSDPLTTAAATTIGATTTNTEGTAESFARSDHTHDISTGAPSTQNAGTTNTEGTSANLARADHIHAIDTAAATGLSATTTNTEGVATSFARSDHTHDISTGVVSTQTPDQTNAEGTSPNLARADHVHNIPAETAVTTSGNTNAEGTNASFARSDHTHQLSSNTPTVGQVMVWTGTDWQAQDPNGLAYSAYSENETVQTTTSTTFVNALTFTTSLPANATYEIQWYLETQNSNKDRENEFEIQIDNTTTIARFTSPRENDSFADDYKGLSGFKRIALTAGSHQFDIDYRADSNTASVRRIRLVIKRVS